MLRKKSLASTYEKKLVPNSRQASRIASEDVSRCNMCTVWQDKTSLLPETWLSVSENCGGKHNSGLVRCFQTHSKSRFVIFQKFITPVKILLQRVWSSPSLLLQLAACCLLLAACRQSVLCRVGKEGKIAFAGVIGEGLFKKFCYLQSCGYVCALAGGDA